MPQKELFGATLASIGEGVLTTDIRGRLSFLNPIAEHLTGWSQADALGKPFYEVFKLVHETTLAPVKDLIETCLHANQVLELGETPILLNRHGGAVSVDGTVAPIHDLSAGTMGAVVVFRDVTVRRQRAKAVEHQATHDPLTGLVNRQEFERRLARMLAHAREFRRQHALCYLDLDQFKIVNDTCGHIAGDALLRQLGAVLKTRIRERDTLARLGGDEFGVLLGECSVDQAVQIAHELREAVQEYRFNWEEKPFAIGVSIGLVPISSVSGDLPRVLSAADSACYLAKERGRNRVCVYRPGDQDLEQRQENMEWAGRLHEALAQERFRLYYQPIVPIQTNATVTAYAEILLRLLGPDGQVMLPGSFLPAAERYQQITGIDRWVVSNTLAALASDQSALASKRYAVNVSGQSLSQQEFLDFVLAELERTGVAPTRICVEITETAAIVNLPAAMRFISTLTAKGCCFALGDFGSGLSSITYLKNFPVEFLKLAGSLVKDIAKDPVDHAMVNMIHRIGKLMGKKTVAEWVEDEVVLTRLKVMGVDCAQGYFFGEPRPL